MANEWKGQYRFIDGRWRDRAYAVWATIGVCVIIGIIIYICNILWQAVATIITTAIIAFLLHGIVNDLERHGLARAVATTITFVILIILVVSFFAILIPLMITQLGVLMSNIPNYTNDLQYLFEEHATHWTTDNSDQINTFISNTSAWIQQQGDNIIQQLAGGLWGSVVSFGTALLIFFIALICAFWILLDLPTMARELMGMFEKETQSSIRVVFNAFGRAFYGWAKSTLLCAILTGFACGITFWVIGIPYSALLGFIAGVLYFVPYVGPIISCVAAAAVGLTISPLSCIAAIVVCVVWNNVIANIVSPKLMKDSVNVHPAIILIVILIGGALAGIAGMLLSIPIAAAAQSIFIIFYENATGQTLATEDGALFLKPKKRKSRRKKQ